MKLPLIVALTTFLSAAFPVSAQTTTVFFDDFNRSSLNGGTYNYSAGSVPYNYLLITRPTAGATSSAVALSSFGSPFNAQLDANTGLVTWSMNLRLFNVADPSGFEPTGYAPAFVLAATGSSFATGSGYAVVWGQSGTTDPVRLVRYSGGLVADANLTNIITATAGLTDVGTENLAIRVTYDPSTHLWQLFGASSASPDPLSPSLPSLAAAAFDNTLVSNPLTHMGGYLHTGGASKAEFRVDNVTVSVTAAIPEPSTYATIIGVGALIVGFTLRRVGRKKS